MQAEIYKLLYVSSANKELDEAGLLEILKHARQKNQEHVVFYSMVLYFSEVV